MPSYSQLLRIPPCLIAGLAMLALVAGCGYPVAEPVNMELISSLRTALSARSETWLAANDEIVEKRHAGGQMRDDEYHVFRSIIDQARGGDWQGAERATLRFQKAQRPTKEQVERVTQFHH